MAVRAAREVTVVTVAMAAGFIFTQVMAIFMLIILRRGLVEVSVGMAAMAVMAVPAVTGR